MGSVLCEALGSLPHVVVCETTVGQSMFNWVSKLASEVQQFGHDCVESIVGDEEEPAAAPAATSSRETQSAEHQEALVESSPTAQSGDENENWAPTELRFVGKQTQHLATFGWGLVEKGAGMALSLLGEEESSPSKGAVAALDELAGNLKVIEAPSSGATAVAEEHPLEKLRSCRGYLGMLRRQAGAGTDPQVSLAAERIVVPRAIAELDFTAELDADTAWVGGSVVGRRMVTARTLLSTPLDPETGAPLEGRAIVDALPEFKRMASEACDTLARMVLEEIADVLARPSRDLNSTLAELLTAHRGEQADEDRGLQAYWFMHKRTSPSGLTLAEHTLLNIVDLVNFAFCEMHRAATTLCQVAQECASWARRNEQPDAAKIKEECMTARGECLSSNVDALVMLEEALEIVVSIFPTAEGTMPFEPMRIGQPMEYIRDNVVVIETEHGEVSVSAGDRHSRKESHEE